MVYKCIVFFILFGLQQVLTDVYLHNPRGSNDRLNERSANRNNQNRIFDSQNNNRGGYNVGDRTDQAANKREDQYQMVYMQSSAGSGKSYLQWEWTGQHGCGGNEDTDPNKMNCQYILQYMCQPVNEISDDSKEAIRDGTVRNTQPYTNPRNNEKDTEFNNRKNGNLNVQFGMQESYESYDKCVKRDRNKGLFIADQKVQGKAINTRQNPNGQRYGYECPEERDYYPYWHPSEWKDIAVLAENASMCDFYTKESFNIKPKHECVEKWPNNNNKYRHYSQYNNEDECKENGGTWMEFHNFLELAPNYGTRQTCNAQKGHKWGIPVGYYTEQCFVALQKPDCRPAEFTRDNHLGNTLNLQAPGYLWEIPHFPSGNEQRCACRLRYNVTTDDYDPYYTDSSNNRNWNPIVISPVQQNPAVDIGADNIPMRLAINTAQYGRIFQDRSHVFHLKKRVNIPNNLNIYNVNVRGKRGNIVQVYPAVEYDFIPNNLTISKNDLVHFQWTGSNTHNNQAPGGDGQTGDDGEGKGGTDRSNIVCLSNRNHNFPSPMTDENCLFNNIEKVYWVGPNSPTSPKPNDIKIQFASSGFYKCVSKDDCAENMERRNVNFNNLLNNAPASFAGMILQFKKGVYCYMCTRNNNFTNRSQKGCLIVE